MAIAIVLNRRRQVPAEDSPAFGAIAERFRRAGELDRAVALCQEGLGKYPRHLSSRVTLGWALLDLGRYDEARAELEQVLKRAPDNLAAIRGLAQLHDRTEHDDVASMQTGPSRWANPEEDPEHVHGDLEDELPDQAFLEAAVIVDSPDAEPGPWIGLQEAPEPEAALIVPVLQSPSDRETAEPHAAIFNGAGFANEVSEVDALAAELLDLGGAQVVEPAAFGVVDEERAWREDGLQLDAPEHLQPAVSLLELVPPSQVVSDDGFIPDEGPGPWPPVFEDEAAHAPDHQVLRLAHGSADHDAWPPVEMRAPVRCAPAEPGAQAAEGSEFATALAKPQRAGLLSALGRFRRRVDARRRAVVSEYVAG